MPALGPKQLSRQAGILSHMGTARSQAAYSVGFLTCLVFNPGHAVEPSGELFKKFSDSDSTWDQMYHGLHFSYLLMILTLRVLNSRTECVAPQSSLLTEL